MNYLDITNKLLIFIGWWINYPPLFKGNLEKKILIQYVLFASILTLTFSIPMFF